jgi:nucleoside-diphosphate-sugar epimerase
MSTAPSSTKILVTGAGGFIALHTILRLLQLHYSVRGTVRTETHGKKVQETLSKYIDTSKLGLVCVDLLKDEGWQDAVRGCGIVLHLASPFPAEEPKNENDLILPARDGTLRVLRAAHAEGVKRLVIVSSVAAVSAGHNGENRTFTESDWTNIEKAGAYPKSKTLAERAAWDFIQSAENTKKMELVSVNPSNVFGPVLDDHHHTSTEWFRTLLRREVPGVTRTQLHLVDVRDLAEMIVQAMSSAEAAGKRFIANGASIDLPEFANILHRNFLSRGYRVPTRILPDVVVRLMAVLIPKVKNVSDALNWTYDLSTERARSILGWQPRPYEQTIVEMAESLLENKMV